MLPSISSAISAQERTDTHEAASSMPSGMPSTSRQMRSACEYPASSRAKPGTTCVARSTNRRTAEALPFPFSARPRPSTSNTHSLWMFSRSREVVRSSTLRGALDHLAQKRGALDEMLEVVEHEERGPLAEVVEQLLLRREAAVHAVEGELDRLGEGGREEVRRGDGGERDEVDAVRVAVDAASGGLEGKPGLARSARPDEREQAAFRVLQQPVDRFELRRPADERRSWQREVLHACLDRLQQRELARQAVDLELVDALGRAQVLEPVCAEVARLVVDQRASRLRQQHLAAVADGCDARALVHVDPDVSLMGHPRLAGVEPHPDADRPIGQASLCVHGRGGRVRSPRESHEERVTLCIDLDAVVGRTGRAHDPTMIVECGAVPVAELVQQRRRALDVREEKGHHSTRELAGHVAMISPGSGHVQCGSCAAAHVSSTGAPATS